MGTGEWIVIALSGLIGVWFIAGMFINRKLSAETLAWLKRGVEPAARIGAPAWISPSSCLVRFTGGEAGAASLFQPREVLISLERRENLPLWLLRRLGGQTDHFILKGNLSSPPSIDLHIFRSDDSKILRSLNADEKRPFRLWEEYRGFMIYQRGSKNEGTLLSVKRFLDSYQGALCRLSLLRQSPHLTIDTRLHSIRSLASKDFITSLIQAFTDAKK